jgi:hypothetical protein
MIRGKKTAFPKMPQEPCLAVTMKVSDIFRAALCNRTSKQIHSIERMTAVNKKVEDRFTLESGKRLEKVDDIERQPVVIHG